MAAELGRLKRVELRDAWASESGDFTPWLAGEANIALLGESIGMELEVQATEEGVGPFRADILCKDTRNDSYVLVENQLERTDHGHLGQLMTYAAGLDAVTIVWVASRFTEEHRAALDWLNDITAEHFSFFGLEIELWRIGDSPMAPKFNVVCKPNDWERSVRQTAASAGNSATQQAQLAFWTGFKAYLEEHESPLKCGKPPNGTWISFGLGRSGTHLCAAVTVRSSILGDSGSGEVRAELVLGDERSRGFYAALQAEKAEIEAAFSGETMLWHKKLGVRACRVYLRRPADLMDQDQWPGYHAWLRERLERMDTVFRGRVKNIDPSAWPVMMEEETE